MFRRSWALFLLLWLVAQPAGLRLALRQPQPGTDEPVLRNRSAGGRWATPDGSSPSELRALPAIRTSLRTSADLWALAATGGASATRVLGSISGPVTARGIGRRLQTAATSPRAPPAFS
ncbi:MAG: hypothetical protein ACO1SX_25360 [Actinomycetota bacterium]